MLHSDGGKRGDIKTFYFQEKNYEKKDKEYWRII